MAKQIIVLETYRGTGQGDSEVRFVFWFSIPAARRVPIAGATSAFKTASAPELAALADGSVIEEVLQIQVPAGTTTAQVRTRLEARYAARAAEIAALPNVNQFYGTFWDGTSWTVG